MMKRTSVCLLEPMCFYKQLFAKAFFNSLKSTFCVIFLLLWSCNVWGQHKWLPEHPRLLFTGAETSEVRRLMETDPLAGELAFCGASSFHQTTGEGKHLQERHLSCAA